MALSRMILSGLISVLMYISISSMLLLPDIEPISPSDSMNPGIPNAVIMALIRPVLIVSSPAVSVCALSPDSTVTPVSSLLLGPVTATALPSESLAWFANWVSIDCSLPNSCGGIGTEYIGGLYPAYLAVLG